MSTAFHPSIDRFTWILEHLPPLLESIPTEQWSIKSSPEKWSKKEILGHLIDSAANNHQRFVRIQFENTPTIRYQQNDWNHYSYHQLQETGTLIATWKQYNLFLKGILQHLPLLMLQREGIGGEGIPFTLDYIIEDYVNHMEHHLRQIVEY